MECTYTVYPRTVSHFSYLGDLITRESWASRVDKKPVKAFCSNVYCESSNKWNRKERLVVPTVGSVCEIKVKRDQIECHLCGWVIYRTRDYRDKGI